MIINFILDEKLNDPTIYKRKYGKYRNVDYVYDLKNNVIVYNELMKSNVEEDQTASKLKNLTKDFYDGFDVKSFTFR